MNQAQKKLDIRKERFAKLYARMRLNGNVDYNKLVRTWNVKEQNPEFKCRRLLRIKEIQNLVTEEIINIYKEAGITPETVINEEKALLNDCKTVDGDKISYNDKRSALQILSNWRESLEFKPKQTTSTHTQTNYLSYIDKDRGKITAKQTKQLKQSDKDE